MAEPIASAVTTGDDADPVFRPRHQRRQKEQTTAAPSAPPLPPRPAAPPPEIFERPPMLATAALPSFGGLAPANGLDIARRLQQAMAETAKADDEEAITLLASSLDD